MTMEFSKASLAMRSSEIRRLMALAADPSIISFSGGMPNNSLFPIDEVDALWSKLPRKVKEAAFQYGPTSGYPALLESLRAYLESRGIPMKDKGLIITTGAQQGINLISKIFLDEGDTVLTESPSFIGGLAAFRSYMAQIISAPIDDEGMIISELKGLLDKEAKMPKLAYLCPYFQNPSGIIYSQERKRQVLDLLSGTGIVMIEDDPYGELWFDEADKPLTSTMIGMSGHNVPICYVGTFAKILGPGMRLGYVVGPKEIVDRLELAKQSMDACTSTYTQVIADAYLRENALSPYLDKMRPTYKRRATIMLDALAANMPDGVTWTKPRGGFYVWVTLPNGLDSTQVFQKALDGGAAFVIGSAFAPDGIKNDSFRLAFSHTPEDRIEEGVKIVAEAVRQFVK